MTLTQAHLVLRQAGLTLTLRTLYRDIRRLGIQPAGSLRCRPQPWPEDLPGRIAAARGVELRGAIKSTRELRKRM